MRNPSTLKRFPRILVTLVTWDMRDLNTLRKFPRMLATGLVTGDMANVNTLVASPGC